MIFQSGGGRLLLSGWHGDDDGALRDRPQAAAHRPGLARPAKPALEQHFGGLQHGVVHFRHEAVQVKAGRYEPPAHVELSHRRQGFDLLPFQNVTDAAKPGVKLAGLRRVVRQILAEKVLEFGHHLVIDRIDVELIAVAELLGRNASVRNQNGSVEFHVEYVLSRIAIFESGCVAARYRPDQSNLRSVGPRNEQ